MLIPINYTTFTTAYPSYVGLPYTVADLTDKIQEANTLFPQLLKCLPDQDTLALATKYIIGYLYEQDDCDTSQVVESVKSRNDEVRYSLAGKGNILANSLNGSRLLRLMKSYNCGYFYAGGKGLCCTDDNC